MTIEELQQILGAQFDDIALLERALVHRSFINEQPDSDVLDNERMEYLGDAVLGLLVADMLYRRYPDLPEGDLTRLRSALVRTEALASLAKQINLGPTIVMGKGEEASGGRERITTLCAVFEAIVGALYLDHGIEAVHDFVMPYFNKMLKLVVAKSLDKDARSIFQEWSQAEVGITPQFITVGEDGPEHSKIFTAAALIAGQEVARGVGRSKQAAAQDAAHNALILLEEGNLVLKIPQAAEQSNSNGTPSVLNPADMPPIIPADLIEEYDEMAHIQSDEM